MVRMALWALCVGCMTTVNAADNAAPEPPVVALDEYARCGQTSLYVVCRLKDKSVSWARVVELLGESPDGQHSFEQIAAAGERLGLRVLGAQLSEASIQGLSPPAILHFEFDAGGTGGSSTSAAGANIRRHLAVAMAWDAEGVWLLDAPFPATKVPWRRLNRIWTGRALLFPDTAEEEQALRAALASPWERPLSNALLLALTLVFLSVVLVAARPRLAAALAHAARALPNGWQALSPAWNLRRPLGQRMLVAAVSVGSLGGTGVVWYAWANWPEPAPRLEVPQEVIDLGELAVGEQQVEVPLRNVGSAPLEFKEIPSTCTCAAPEHPEPLGPREARPLKVKLQVSPGPMSVELTLATNDPRGPRYVTLRWHGPAEPGLYPPSVAGSAAVGKAYERTVRVTYPGGLSAVAPEFVRFECDVAGVDMQVNGNDPLAFRTAAVPSAVTTAGYLDLRLHVPAARTAMTLDTAGHIVLRYGGAEHRLRLPIRVDFREGLRAEPDSVLFAAVSSEELIGQARTVRLYGEPASEELRVVHAPAWLECEVAEGPDWSHRLALRVKEARAELAAGADVVVLEDGQERQLVVEVGTVTVTMATQ
jgi:hypothetical protein